MTRRLFLALLIASCGVGCGKHSEAPSATSSSAVSPSDGRETSAAPEPAQPEVGGNSEKNGRSSPRVAAVAPGNADADLAAVLADLTQALRKYSFEHQRLPKTLSEVTAAGYVKNVPQAPAGKKFEIDSKTVQVVLTKQ